MISPGIVFVFLIFLFFGLLWGGGEGIKRAKMFQNEEKLCVILHISGTINHRIIICGAQVWNNNIFRFYFYFYKILIFWVFKRVKNGSKWQKLCLLHFISQEPYIIWSWIMVNMCKRIISSVFFTFFSNLIFVVNSWVNVQKMA